MRTNVGRRRVKRIGNEWRVIRRSCMCRGANTGRGTWCFGGRICRVCSVGRKFGSSGNGRVRQRLRRKSGQGLFIFVRSVREFTTPDSVSRKGAKERKEAPVYRTSRRAFSVACSNA